MASGPYFLGIDGGTESVRVGIFDREGTQVGSESHTYALRHPRPGWAEQDPDEWWSALVQAVPAALQQAGVRPEEIAGISVDATAATVLAVDADGRALRPAIMWMDVRAFEQAERIAETGDP